MTHNRPFEVDDETLVAYLDGELDGDDSALLDQSLANDAALRNRLEKLKVTWDLLDDLPDIQPQRDLTQSTIAMVTLSLKQEQAAGSRRWSSNRWVLLGVGVVLMYICGAWLAWTRSSWQTQQTLNDLPILARYSQLAHIDSVAWLEKLASVDKLVEAGNHVAAEPSEQRLPERNADRLTWIQQIDDKHRARLAANHRALRLESPERQAELRRIGALLSQPVDGEQSRQSDTDYSAVVAAYASILDRVGTTELLRLKAMKDLDERAAQVAKLAHRETALGYAKKLSAHDRAALRNWSYNLQTEWDFFSRFSDPNTQVVSELYKDISESFLQEEDLALVKEQLSEQANELLAGLDERGQRDVLGWWLYNGVESVRTASKEPTPEELSERFHSLSLEKQSEIEFLSEREARSELSQ